MADRSNRLVTWFSVARSPSRTLILGLGVGRSGEDRTFCVIVQLVALHLAIGPHYTPERAIFSAARWRESRRLRRELDTWPAPTRESCESAAPRSAEGEGC